MPSIEYTDEASSVTGASLITGASPIAGASPLPHIDAIYILEPETVVAAQVPSETAAAQDKVPAPELATLAITLSNEFGKGDNCTDLQRLLTAIGYARVDIVPVSLVTYCARIAALVTAHCGDTSRFIVVNLCDGCECDGYPGVGVVRELNRLGIAYTGADAQFYEVCTSKPVLKRRLRDCGVPTGPFVELEAGRTTVAEVDALGVYPLIVKPSVSYASISITDRSVVFSGEEALLQAEHVRGVDAGLAGDGNTADKHGASVFAEPFLAGREFTVFVDGDAECGVHVHLPVERVFDERLKTYQRILAFDRYWDGYDLEGRMVCGDICLLMVMYTHTCACTRHVSFRKCTSEPAVHLLVRASTGADARTTHGCGPKGLSRTRRQWLRSCGHAHVDGN